MKAGPLTSTADSERLRELENRNAALRIELAQADAAQERSRTFLAHASRELRNPVRGIHEGVQDLLHGPAGEDRDQLLLGLFREAARGTRLVTSLLRLARLDAGEPLVPAPCDVVSVCAAEGQRLLSRTSHLDLVVLPEPQPARLPHLDEQAVREIVAQLLDNARRHARTRITLSVSASQDLAEVRVTDDGSGIPPGLVDLAFERFTALDDLGGAGLGLAIARDLARRHHGDLVYEDGAFVLRLPVRQNNAPP